MGGDDDDILMKNVHCHYVARPSDTENRCLSSFAVKYAATLDKRSEDDTETDGRRATKYIKLMKTIGTMRIR